MVSYRSKILLKVAETCKRKPESKTVMLDSTAKEALEVNDGDYVFLSSHSPHRVVLVKVESLPSTDEGKGILRINEKIRDQLKAKLGKEVSVEAIKYKIVCTCKSVRGFCDFGHKIGDVYEYYPPPMSKSKGRICPAALHSVFPWIWAARTDVESTQQRIRIWGCPDLVNLTMWEMKCERVSNKEIPSIYPY